MKGIPEQITNALSNLFSKKGNSVVGVDIGTSAIKVVQLRRAQGKAILETYGELALGPYANLAIGQATGLSPEKRGDALSDVLREANVTTKVGGFSVALASSLVSIIEIPVVSGGKLEEMVPIEARRYIPAPISEVALDWRLIPEEELPHASNEPPRSKSFFSLRREDDTGENSKEGGAKKMKVMIAAIHNETINIYQEIAAQSGLDVGFFEIEVFSLARSLLGKERITALILDIGAGTSKLSISENGVPFSTHLINHGSQDMTLALARSQGLDILRAEELKREVGLSKDPRQKENTEAVRIVLASIFSEANRALLDYERKYHKAVDKIILSGGGSLLKGIVPIAEENFNTEIIYGDPFLKVEFPAFLEPVLKGAGPNFAVAIGIALRRLQELE